MHKSRLIKTLRGVWRSGFSPTDFYLAILHPSHAPTGIPVETLWQEMKLKLLNANVLKHAWLRARVCVRVSAAVCFSEACILTKIGSEKKRAASHVTVTLNIVGFVNVLLGASLLPSESHSPWGSRGLYERCRTVGEVLFLCRWMEAKFFASLVSKLWCSSFSLTSFFPLRCIALPSNLPF